HEIAQAALSAPRRRRQANVAVVVLTLLCAALAAGLVAVASETYEPARGFPFVRHKPLPKPPPRPAAQPAPDLSKLTYAAPIAVSRQLLRTAPLACDVKGNLYAV